MPFFSSFYAALAGVFAQPGSKSAGGVVAAAKTETVPSIDPTDIVKWSIFAIKAIKTILGGVAAAFQQKAGKLLHDRAEMVRALGHAITIADLSTGALLIDYANLTQGNAMQPLAAADLTTSVFQVCVCRYLSGMVWAEALVDVAGVAAGFLYVAINQKKNQSVLGSLIASGVGDFTHAAVSKVWWEVLSPPSRIAYVTTQIAMLGTQAALFLERESLIRRQPWRMMRERGRSAKIPRPGLKSCRALL